MKVYKFYAQSNEKFLLFPCKDQNVEFYLRRKIVLTVPRNLREFNCFELVFDAERKTLVSINELNMDYIKPETIKFANEINEITSKELSETDKDISQLSLYTIQDVIDRGLFYGSEFESELNLLLDRFPLKVEMVKADENDLGISQRKVSKY